jgi:gentisate 1,2-dioxygenase
MQATSTIYIGFQLLLPGETAPAHKHTASAARIVVEGEGAYTVVDGEKLPMKSGDLILTPGGCWHDHGHSGKEPVIWLDALDLPLLFYLEGSYAIEAPLQSPRNRPDTSQVEYHAAGIAPVRRRDRAPPAAYPLMRYPWERTEEALRHLGEHNGGEVAELDYINPETGEGCLRTMGFTAMMLQPTNEPAAAALVERRLSCRKRPGNFDHQWAAVRVGPQGHYLGAGICRDRAQGG